MTMKTGFMRNLAIITIVSVLVVSCTVVAFGYMFSRSGNVQNVFKPAEVSCEVEEVFDGTIKSSIKIKNTSNIDCFVRVRLVSYWVDGSGKRVGKPSAMPTFTLAENWAKGEEDTYYYKYAIAAKGITPYLLNGSMELKTDSFNGNPVYQVVEVFAEAIQAEPADARGEAWPNWPHKN